MHILSVGIKILHTNNHHLYHQAKQLDVDPRACIGSFFDRIQVADAEYKKHFDLEVQAFITRITKRAAEKVEEALAEEEVSNYFHHFGSF